MMFVLKNDWFTKQDKSDKSQDNYFSRHFGSHFRSSKSAALGVNPITIRRDLEMAFLGVTLEIYLKLY